MKLRHTGSEEGYHLFHDRRHKGGEKRSDVNSEFLPRVSSASAKNSAEDIPTANVVGYTTIAQREGKGSDMISDDTIRGVNAVGILCTKFAPVRPDTGQFLDFVEYRDEDIGVVI